MKTIGQDKHGWPIEIEEAKAPKEAVRIPEFIGEISAKVKKAAIAFNKKHPGKGIVIIEQEEQYGGGLLYTLVLDGFTVDNPGQQTWLNDTEEGLLSDIKNLRPDNSSKP